MFVLGVHTVIHASFGSWHLWYLCPWDSNYNVHLPRQWYICCTICPGGTNSNVPMIIMSRGLKLWCTSAQTAVQVFHHYGHGLSGGHCVSLLPSRGRVTVSIYCHQGAGSLCHFIAIQGVHCTHFIAIQGGHCTHFIPVQVINAYHHDCMFWGVGAWGAHAPCVTIFSGGNYDWF